MKQLGTIMQRLVMIAGGGQEQVYCSFLSGKAVPIPITVKTRPSCKSAYNVFC